MADLVSLAVSMTDISLAKQWRDDDLKQRL